MRLVLRSWHSCPCLLVSASVVVSIFTEGGSYSGLHSLWHYSCCSMTLCLYSWILHFCFPCTCLENVYLADSFPCNHRSTCRCLIQFIFLGINVLVDNLGHFLKYIHRSLIFCPRDFGCCAELGSCLEIYNAFSQVSEEILMQVTPRPHSSLLIWNRNCQTLSFLKPYKTMSWWRELPGTYSKESDLGWQPPLFLLSLPIQERQWNMIEGNITLSMNMNLF